MVFVLPSVGVLYQVYRFISVEPSLSAWDESKLIMVNSLFNVLLDLLHWYFIDGVCIYVHQSYCPIISTFHYILDLFWYQNNTGLVECVSNNLRRISVSYSLNIY
jgi:hypothetical protein